MTCVFAYPDFVKFSMIVRAVLMWEGIGIAMENCPPLVLVAVVTCESGGGGGGHKLHVSGQSRGMFTAADTIEHVKPIDTNLLQL
jgi:hypothetical protein